MMITGRQLIEKMYSENEEERLYSTGDSELDDLLERAFCDGYEYAQREFNSKAQKEMRRRIAKDNAGPLSGLLHHGLAETDIELERAENAKKIAEKTGKSENEILNRINRDNLTDASRVRVGRQAKSEADSMFRRIDRLAEKETESGMNRYKNRLKNEASAIRVEKAVEEEARKQGVQDSIKKHEEEIKKLRENNKAKIALRDAKRWAKKNPKTTAAIGLGTVAIGTGTGIAIHKHNKNKKK